MSMSGTARAASTCRFPMSWDMSREQAEQTLKDAGLTLGKVTPEYSAKVAANMILRQNVSYTRSRCCTM